MQPKTSQPSYSLARQQRQQRQAPGQPITIPTPGAPPAPIPSGEETDSFPQISSPEAGSAPVLMAEHPETTI